MQKKVIVLKSSKSVKMSHAGKPKHIFNLFLSSTSYVKFISILRQCEAKEKVLKTFFLVSFTYWNAGEGNWRRLPRDAKATAIGSEFC